jgi:hypothetical protein
MNSYHFDIGNSNDGPLGMCARVDAPDPDTALAILQERIDTLTRGWEIELQPCTSKGEYIAVYFNPDNLTVDMLSDDMVENIEDEDEYLMSCPSCQTKANPIAGNTLWCPKCGFQWTLTPEDAKRLIEEI